MENSFALAIKIANEFVEMEFFPYFANINNLKTKDEVNKMKETKRILWGKNFGDEFITDPDVPEHLKVLHKKIFERSLKILSL